MTSQEIREKFLEFFKERGHTVVPSSSLIPDDPSVLLTTAGMQQFKRYFTGELDPMKDFGSLNTVSVQKCFRTSDIDEVGDASHLTFFEMLGNFSFGEYFKEEAIKYAHEFITKEMGLAIDYVSVFEGDSAVPADTESEKIWKSLGIKDVRRAGREDNFWGPTGAEGPCGPTTEVYVKTSGGESVEVWNIVFNEFYLKGGKLTPLKIKGVDTGMGLERLAMVVQKVPTIFDTDLFEPFQIILYGGEKDVRSARIIADHIRGAIFLITDGVMPSNKDVGYILRRSIRRAMVHANKAEMKENILLLSNDRLMSFVNATIDFYGKTYSQLINKRYEITKVLEEEMNNFGRTLRNGLHEFNLRFPGMVAQELKRGEPFVSFIVWTKIGKEAFDLYQTFGFPIEVIKELLEERLYKFDERGFNEFKKTIEEEKRKHQEISRAGVEKKFGGHGLVLDTGEIKAGSDEELKKVTCLHTATHLLNQALREVLGTEVAQRGSDITTERARFDFSFPRKLLPEEIKKVEAIVNEKINEDLPVNFKEMSKDEAEKSGALHFFKGKYPERVKVYYVGKSLEDAWSKEFCGGPHVSRTGEIGKFKITKEEASAAGVRRIRATVV